RLRRAENELGSIPNFEIIFAEKAQLPFVYKRGSFILAVNPGAAAVSLPLDKIPKAHTAKVYAIGDCTIENGNLHMKDQSFGIWRI
ncbi:MAG: hypothetical protein FWB82_01855, partial [Treponema sp.]|nr:hypothetical protein [Treponema sp.]